MVASEVVHQIEAESVGTIVPIPAKCLRVQICRVLHRGRQGAGRDQGRRAISSHARHLRGVLPGAVGIQEVPVLPVHQGREVVGQLSENRTPRCRAIRPGCGSSRILRTPMSDRKSGNGSWKPMETTGGPPPQWVRARMLEQITVGQRPRGGTSVVTGTDPHIPKEGSIPSRQRAS
jgi:hypothetical protein